MKDISVSQNDFGKTIEAYKGDVILIRLPENPSTGYQWQIAGADNQFVEFVNSDFLTDPGAIFGGGGIRIFTFKTKASGTVKIPLTLRREWEPENSVIDSFEVTIRIRDNH